MAKSQLKSQQNRLTRYLLIPAVAVIFAFTTIPAITTLSFAFFHWHGFQRGSFAGFENFKRLFSFPFKDQLFLALEHNIFVFVAVFLLQTTLGIFFAYGLYRIRKGQRFFRSVVFFPVIFSLIITGYLWQIILNPFYGPLSFLAHSLHLNFLAKAWLGSTTTALPSLIGINIWRWVGFPTIIFLAGLNSISEDFLEAARIDGASEGQIFRKIMLPLLGPSMTIISVMTFIGAFEWFDLPYVLGGSSGGPAGTTDTLALMFYRLSFGSVDSIANQIGVASALGVVIFSIVGTGATLGAKYLRSREVEA
jgi:raffinose/stachyose/melibiose transport system permease protein